MTDTWLSPEVAGELVKAAGPPLNLSNEAIAFLAAIVEARSFRSLYGDTAAHPRLWDGSLDQFPPLDQIGAAGPDGRPTHPFGAWQWEPATAGDIAEWMSTPSVAIEDQIRGTWWLAQRDYKAHGGDDLLLDLHKARRDVAALDAIATRLRATWPGGTRAGFAHRYIAALPSDAPPAPPLPPPSPGAEAPKILLHYGETRRIALDGWDAAGELEALPTTGAVVTVDDPAICVAVLDVGGQFVTISEKAPGKTCVHYVLAGLRADLEVTVATLVRVAFNPDRPVDPQQSAGPSG